MIDPSTMPELSAQSSSPAEESKGWFRRTPQGDTRGNRYRADYFCHLAHRYRTLDNAVGNPHAKAIADQSAQRAEEIARLGIRGSAGVGVSWREIHAFEHALLLLLPNEALLEEAEHLVHRSTQICGATRATTWEVAELLKSENPDSLDYTALRHRLLRIQTEAHQAQMSAQALEQTRALAFNHCSAVILGLVGLVLLVALASWFVRNGWGAKRAAEFAPIMPQIVTIALMGALGAGVSKLLKISAIPTDARLETVSMQLGEIRRQTRAAMLIGATAAIVLHCAYASDLLKVAGLFPEVADDIMKGATDQNSRLWIFFQQPFQTADAIGKSLFWSFVAGFSERFFQDTVDRLVGRASEQKSGSNVPTAG